MDDLDLDALQKQIGLSPLEVRLIRRLRALERVREAAENISGRELLGLEELEAALAALDKDA